MFYDHSKDAILCHVDIAQAYQVTLNNLNPCEALKSNLNPGFKLTYEVAQQIRAQWQETATGFMKQDKRPVYFGGISDEQASGLGIMFFTNNFVYVGEFSSAFTVANAMHGHGILLYAATHSYYDGPFVNNKRCSSLCNSESRKEGTLVFHGQVKYVGTWLNDVSHGRGKRKITQLHTKVQYDYSGEFQHGKATGQGLASYPDGNTYSGQFKENVRSGMGIYTWRSTITGLPAQTYVGSWENDKMNGCGKMNYGASGEYALHTYEGKFVNDQRHGYGVLAYQLSDQLTDGISGNSSPISLGCTARNCIHTLEGDWKQDLLSYGVFKCSSSGSSYTGSLEAYQPHGTGMFHWATGCMYAGEFRDGVPHGTGTLRMQNGDLLQGTFIDGKCQGRGVYTFVSGGHFIGVWKDNICPELSTHILELSKHVTKMADDYNRHWKQLTLFVTSVLPSKEPASLTRAKIRMIRLPEHTQNAKKLLPVLTKKQKIRKNLVPRVNV